MEEKEYEFNQQIYRINEDWEFKMVAVNEEYESKLMEADRQKEYHRMRCL